MRWEAVKWEAVAAAASAVAAAAAWVAACQSAQTSSQNFAALGPSLSMQAADLKIDESGSDDAIVMVWRNMGARPADDLLFEVIALSDPTEPKTAHYDSWHSANPVGPNELMECEGSVGELPPVPEKLLIVVQISFLDSATRARLCTRRWIRRHDPKGKGHPRQLTHMTIEDAAAFPKEALKRLADCDS